MDERRLIAITGAGGMIGTRLIRALPSRYEPVRLSRSKPEGWLARLDGAYGVVHLAGEPIAAKRWSPEQKQIIRDSRVEGTRALVDAIAACRVRPKVLVSASAIGFYGDRGSEKLDETSAPGTGFLAETCKAWEAEALRAETLGVRTVVIRTGIVLAREGGALAKMIPPFRFFAGGPLGSGRQIMSWIHIDDEAAAILFCLQSDLVRGPVNLTAPAPVSMGEFSAKLGRVMHRPSFMPVPAFALKALLGEMADALLLSGQHVEPAALLQAGFRFRYPSLEGAFTDLLTRRTG